MKKVLFIGEINVDLILGGLESFPVLDREISCTSIDLTIGSSTAICACAYASLGGDTSFLGLAGNDSYGDFMVEGLQSFGIQVGLVQRTSAVKTGVTVNLIYGKTRTQVTYPGTIAAFGRNDFSLSSLDPFDHVHLAGLYLQHSLLPGVGEVLAHARSRGLSTSLDPQWDSSEKWDHMRDWLPLLDYFFVNEDEALSITGSSKSSEACTRLGELTACPIVKMGAEGVLYLDNGKVMPAPAFEVEIQDTTGAGDSFDAAFLYSILEKQNPLRDSVRFANAAGARSCTFVGGVNARSTYGDVRAFLESRGK